MRKVLRFTASWCMPCKALAAVLENAKLDVPIEVIDIDVYPELAQEYGVRGVPTLVVVDEGIEVRRSSGLMNAQQIQELIA